MKKIRVIKDLPFAKVGEEFDLNCDGELYIWSGRHTIIMIEKMIKDGWLEWVEEPKTLEDKFRDKYSVWYPESPNNYKMIALAHIAKEHYLEVFDKFNTGKIVEVELDAIIKHIGLLRKALENA